MLIISRKKLEKIMIGDDIELVVIDTGRSRVRLGIKAPKAVSIHSVTVPVGDPANPTVRPTQTDEDSLDGVDQPTPLTALAGGRRF